MKRIFRLFMMIFLIAFTFTFETLMAQGPPPPNGGLNGITPADGPIGTPIGDSILPLMIFVLVYVGMKLYDHHQLQKEKA